MYGAQAVARCMGHRRLCGAFNLASPSLCTSSPRYSYDVHSVAAPDIFFCRCYGGAWRFSEGAMK